MNNLEKKRYLQGKLADYYINKYIKNYDDKFDSDITKLEKKYKLFNKDGTRKKYLESQRDSLHKKCVEISKDLTKSGLPYLAKITNVIGEKGDTRTYISIYIYHKK